MIFGFDGDADVLFGLLAVSAITGVGLLAAALVLVWRVRRAWLVSH